VLLAEARRRLESFPGVEVALIAHDLLEGDLEQGLGAETFSLVAAIGILHHVPGRDQRKRLLAKLAARVAPGGLFAASLWQFGARERFQRRIADWGEYDAPAFGPLEIEDLEPGDHLLRWGSDGLRYCHFIDRSEETELLAAAKRSGLNPLATYEADGESGDLNRYLLLARR
jgi:SAM-dependent methyltransferase